MDISGLRKFLAPEIIFGFGARHLAGQYCKTSMLKEPYLSLIQVSYNPDGPLMLIKV